MILREEKKISPSCGMRKILNNFCESGIGKFLEGTFY